MKVTYIVNSVFSSRTYILSEEGSDDIWLIDCGDIDDVMVQLSSQHVIKGVLLTHAHYDHIYGLPRLSELFPFVRVYTNAFGRKMLGDARKNMSKYHDNPIVFESEGLVECGEGDEIDLFEGVRAKVYYTPGHNPSCLTYEVEGFLFTGDAFIPGVKVVTTLPGADKHLAIQSVARINQLATGRIICPGHEVVGENGSSSDRW